MKFTTVLLAFAISAVPALAKGPRSSLSSSHSHASTSGNRKASYCTACARDSNGRIKRGKEAKNAFKHEHPCPLAGRSSGGCPGYVIDHLQALKHGGTDTAANIQWQTKDEAKAKDRVED